MVLCLFAGEDLMRDDIIGGGDEMVSTPSYCRKLVVFLEQMGS